MKKIALFLVVFSLLFIIKPEKNMAAESLQSLINSTKEGAVIKLDNQTYEGNLVIRKSITIIGSKNTVIKGDGTGNVIAVKAPHVTLKNLTVVHSGMSRDSLEEYAAIKIYSNHNVVDHVNVRDSFHGIYLSQGQYNTISNCNVKGMGNGEIAGQGNGLQIYYANHNILINNIIEGTRDGIFFNYANHNQIDQNHISNTRYGLHYMYSDSNSFKSNTFTMNIGGAAIMNSNHLVLKNNQFIFNYGNQSFGLLLLQANDNDIENNTFYMNQRGIYLDQATRNLFRSNQIMQNQIGIELWASSNEQTFTLNKINGNTFPEISVAGQGTGNSWSKNGKGNDWGSSFPLPDLNQDGIGDFPVTYNSSLHQLFQDQELTFLFLKSPAIQIYDKMNALLGNDEVMFTDRYPLITKSKNNVPFIIITVLIIAAIVIFIKGRHRLCITFGRNGKKI